MTGENFKDVQDVCYCLLVIPDMTDVLTCIQCTFFPAYTFALLTLSLILISDTPNCNLKILANPKTQKVIRLRFYYNLNHHAALESSTNAMLLLL